MYAQLAPFLRAFLPPHGAEMAAATLAAADDVAGQVPLDKTAIVLAIIGGITTIVSAAVALRSKLVRTGADVRGEQEVENGQLRDAAALAFQAAKESRDQSVSTMEAMKAANAETVKALRDSLVSRDEQIADQRFIISDLRRSLERRDSDHDDVLQRLAQAQEREQHLIQTRDDLERKLADAQHTITELTLPPETVAMERAKAALHLVTDDTESTINS